MRLTEVKFGRFETQRCDAMCARFVINFAVTKSFQKLHVVNRLVCMLPFCKLCDKFVGLMQNTTQRPVSLSSSTSLLFLTHIMPAFLVNRLSTLTWFNATSSFAYKRVLFTARASYSNRAVPGIEHLMHAAIPTSPVSFLFTDSNYCLTFLYLSAL